MAGNGDFDNGEDDFLDCGCDRLCDMDANYPGPDEGENDGIFQASYMAGFQSNRPARGVRRDSLGLVGEGDGLWARAIVLEQGDTRVAIVAIDTVGYFYDEVVAIREMIASAQPLRYPAINPSVAPITVLIATAATATASDTLPPTSTRVSVSRPNLSVPSGWARLGGLRASGNCIA